MTEPAESAEPAEPLARPKPDVEAENAAIRRWLVRLGLAAALIALVIVLGPLVGIDGAWPFLALACLAAADVLLWIGARVRRARRGSA